jgi:hypothetical protein
MRRPAVLGLALLVAAGVAALPADAAPKKKPAPIKKTVQMSLLPVPDPPDSSLADSCTRAQLENVSIHSEKLVTKGAGLLTATVTGFTGDWDITVTDDAGDTLATGSGTTTPNASAGTDTVTLKLKKKATLYVHYCNFVGTPQATGSYVFTYK